MSIIYGKAGAETGIPRCPKNFAPVGLSESADPEGAFKWTGSRWEVEDPPRTRSSTSVHVEKSQGGKIDLVMLGWLEDGCLEGITLVLKMTGDRTAHRGSPADVITLPIWRNWRCGHGHSDKEVTASSKGPSGTADGSWMDGRRVFETHVAGARLKAIVNRPLVVT